MNHEIARQIGDEVIRSFQIRVNRSLMNMVAKMDQLQAKLRDMEKEQRKGDKPDAL